MELTLGEIASNIGGEVIGNSNHLIKGVSQIQEAKSGTITFFSNPAYRKYLDSANADAIIVEKQVYLKQKMGIVVKNSQTLWISYTFISEDIFQSLLFPNQTIVFYMGFNFSFKSI